MATGRCEAMSHQSDISPRLQPGLNGTDNAIAICLAVALFAVYLFTYRGGFHSIDEVSMFSVTESMVKRRAFDTNQIAWSQWTTSQREAQGFFGQDGNVYSKKGWALSLFAMPFYWLALHLSGLGMLQTTLLLNAAITATTGGLVYLYIRRLTYPQSASVLIGLIFGLATTAWVYAKYLFSEPVAGWLLFMAAFFLLGFKQDRRTLLLIGAGLAAGLAVVARANNVLCLPLFGLYLLASLTGRTRHGRLTMSRRWFVHILIFAVSLAVTGSVMAMYNWVRAGNTLQTGYDLTIFSPSLWLGLYKLLFSPLRGLFWFSPILLLSPIAFFAFLPRHRAEALLSAAIILFNVLLFSAWTSGEGLSWGSRFLVPILPFAVLPLVTLLSDIPKAVAVIGQRILTALGGVSVLVQVLGVTVNPWLHLAHLHSLFAAEFLEDTPALYEVKYSPIWGQIQQNLLADIAKSDLAWLQPWKVNTGIAVAVLVPLIIAGVSLARLVRSGQISRSQLVLYPLVSVVSAAVVSSLALTSYFSSDLQFGPPDDALHQILTRLDTDARAEDAIITLMPYHYHVVMNIYKRRQPIYGFSQMSPPLPPEAIRLLENATNGHERIWLITSGLRPADPDNGVESWLAQHAFKTSDEWYDDFRLCLYASPQGLEKMSVSETPGALWGDAIQLKRYTVGPVRQQTGQVITVSLVWQARQASLLNCKVFIHLVSPEGVLVAQRDGEPAGGFRPTSTWTPGETVIDRHGLLIPPGVPPGRYELWAGLYQRETGQRLPVRLSDGRAGDHLVLSEVVVE